MNYLLHISVLVGIYAILAESLNLLAGYTGLLSMTQAAIFGVGAYAYAILASRVGLGYPLALSGAVLIAMAIGFFIAWPVVRYRDDYVVLVTFSFQIIMTSVMTNLTSVTGGPTGYPGIAQPALFGHVIVSEWASLALIFSAVIVVVVAATVLVRSPLGRVLKAIREDRTWTRALGYDPTLYQVGIFTFASGLAGLAGALFAGYHTYIDPSSFSIGESVYIISIVIIGGAGSIRGPLIGALVLVGLPEALRLVGLPASVAANLRQIAYGILLVAMVMLKPSGILGDYDFNRQPRAKKVEIRESAGNSWTL